jgi:hypothetical protein
MLFRKLGAKILYYDWGPALVNRVTGEDLAALKRLQSDLRENPRKFFSSEEFLNQNTDGAGNPLAKVYTRGEGKQLFTKFSEVDTEVRFLNKRWIPLLGHFLPRSLESHMSKLWGWHLWIIGRK